MKSNIRILGIDDGPFQRENDTKTTIVGVLMRMDGTIESVLSDHITIDGDDTTSVILHFVEQIGGSNVNVILTEGITFGGFDIINPDEIHRKTGIPFISITKGKGDLESMTLALEKHGNLEKLEKIRILRPVRKIIGNRLFTLNMSGISEKEAILLLRKLMRVGTVPEPLRMADMIAFSFKTSSENMP